MIAVIKRVILLYIFLCIAISCKSQIYLQLKKGEIPFYSIYSQQNKKKSSIQNEVIKKSQSKDSYQFMSLRGVIGALNAIIYINGNEYFIDQQKTIIDNIIYSARYSFEIPDNKFQDHFKGWTSLTKNKAYHNEVVLYEGYSFFYITQFLFYLKTSGWIYKSDENLQWWEEKLHFVENNVWNKWFSRSLMVYGNNYRFFLRGRTHMASHWAGVALYLEKISSRSEIKNQCKKLYDDYDLLLKRNLRVNPKEKSAFIWNSTYDDVSNTFALKTESSVIQDVSHANHVVSYITEAYEIGNKNWTIKDIRALCSTLKSVIYNKKNNTFKDNVDGSNDMSRPGWGNFQADGWVKLSKYDPDVYQIFYKFSKNVKILEKFNQELQFEANLMKWKISQ